MENGSRKVFISHASKDKDFVDRLVSDLAAQGVPVWYDKLDVRLGDSIPGKINSGISEAKYFLIVLSPAAVESKWVREEMNAALMRQVASAGTFLLTVLVEDCDIPPLLDHRRFADFRGDYEAGLEELLEVFGRDAKAAELAGEKLVHPWPDLEVSDSEFIYLHSTRFDKFFRMNCDLEWTADRTIDYIVSTISLPWRKEFPEMGMRGLSVISWCTGSIPYLFARRSRAQESLSEVPSRSVLVGAMKTYIKMRLRACGSRTRCTR